MGDPDFEGDDTKSEEEIAGDFLREQSKFKDFASTYMEKRNVHINDRYSKGGINLKELGGEFGLSKSHVHRIVQKGKPSDK